MPKSHVLLPFTFALLVAIHASPCGGEIPKRSKEQLTKSASHVVSGTVARTYERKRKTSRDFEHTYGVAEISIDNVQKGADILPGDHIFVRYWRRRWIGGGNPDPGHNGHWDVPAENDAVVVYVKGTRKTGFDVLSPNGFYAVTKRAKSDSGGNER